MAIYFAKAQRLTGNIRFVTHHGNRQFGWQTGNKVWPDVSRVHGIGGGAIHHKQHTVGLFDFLPGTFDTNAFNFIAGIAQTGSIDDVQRHTVDMNMLTQYVASRPRNVGHNSRLTACQRVQQARFPGVRATGNDYLHPFAQQATLTRFGTNSIEIADNVVELRFNLAVRQEVDFFIREVDRRFDIDAQVSECFHKMIYPCGKCALQRVQRRASGLLRAGIDQVGNRLGLG